MVLPKLIFRKRIKLKHYLKKPFILKNHLQVSKQTRFILDSSPPQRI